MAARKHIDRIMNIVEIMIHGEYGRRWDTVDLVLLILSCYSNKADIELVIAEIVLFFYEPYWSINQIYDLMLLT